MRVIALRTLREFWTDHADAEEPLKAWNTKASQSDWKTPADIKIDYATADILGGNRVVFNIKGNHYRLVVKVEYAFSTIYIRFVGTHAQYDKIDAETI